MTPEEHLGLKKMLESTVARQEWDSVKSQMVYVVDALRSETDIEKLRELSFVMAKIITMLMESSKRQHDELVQWLKKKLEE